MAIPGSGERVVIYSYDNTLCKFDIVLRLEKLSSFSPDIFGEWLGFNWWTGRHHCR